MTLRACRIAGRAVVLALALSVRARTAVARGTIAAKARTTRFGAETAVGAARRAALVAAGLAAVAGDTTGVATRSSGTGAAVAALAGKPAAHRWQLLARRHAPALLAATLASRRATFRARQVAVDFLAVAPRRLAAAYGFLADAVVRAQLARLVLAAGPGGAGATLGAVFGDVATGAALVQHRAQGQYRLRGTEAAGLAQLLDALGVERFAFATAQVARQLDAAVADALEPADQETL